MDPTSHMLTIATRDLFSELDRSVKAVAPMQFWMVSGFHKILEIHLFKHLFLSYVGVKTGINVSFNGHFS